MKMPANYQTQEFQAKYSLRAFDIHRREGHGHPHIISPDWEDADVTPTAYKCNCFDRAILEIDAQEQVQNKRDADLLVIDREEAAGDPFFYLSESREP